MRVLLVPPSSFFFVFNPLFLRCTISFLNYFCLLSSLPFLFPPCLFSSLALFSNSISYIYLPPLSLT